MMNYYIINLQNHEYLSSSNIKEPVFGSRSSALPFTLDEAIKLSCDLWIRDIKTIVVDEYGLAV